MNLNGMGGPGMGSGTHTRQRVAATGGSKTWRAGMSGPRVHIRLFLSDTGRPRVSLHGGSYLYQ